MEKFLSLPAVVAAGAPNNPVEAVVVVLVTAGVLPNKPPVVANIKF